MRTLLYETNNSLYEDFAQALLNGFNSSYDKTHVVEVIPADTDEMKSHREKIAAKFGIEWD